MSDNILEQLQEKLKKVKVSKNGTATVDKRTLLANLKSSFDTSKTEKLNSNEKSVRGKNGGARLGAGRKTNQETLTKRGVRAWVDEHANEKIPINVLDEKTGKTITIMKPRIAYAMEKLFEIGTGNGGNASAIDMWLNRCLGRPSQPVRGEGEDDPPINLRVNNFEDILKKAYGN